MELAENLATQEEDQENMLSLTKKPTDAEIKFLEQITRPGVQIELAVPVPLDKNDEVNIKEWYTSTAIVCRAWQRAEQQQQALLPCLGRLLQIAQEVPEIWAGSGSFAEWMRDVLPVKFGVSKSTAYEALELASRFPGLTIREFKQIGRTSFRVLKKAIPRGQETAKWAVALLEKAAEVSTPQLRDVCEKKGYIEAGETSGAFLRLACNKNDLKFFNSFFNDPQYQAYCSTANMAAMLRRAIEEATTEWAAQAENNSGQYTNGHAADAVDVIDVSETEVPIEAIEAEAAPSDGAVA